MFPDQFGVDIVSKASREVASENVCLGFNEQNPNCDLCYLVWIMWVTVFRHGHWGVNYILFMFMFYIFNYFTKITWMVLNSFMFNFNPTKVRKITTTASDVDVLRVVWWHISTWKYTGCFYLLALRIKFDLLWSK